MGLWNKIKSIARAPKKLKNKIIKGTLRRAKDKLKKDKKDKKELIKAIWELKDIIELKNDDGTRIIKQDLQEMTEDELILLLNDVINETEKIIK